jgi:hypothetical protein
MGLYLCVFNGDDELNGVEVGAYADFNELRDYIIRTLENNVAGSRFPLLNLHSDSDGEWSVSDCAKLSQELAEIESEMRLKPPVPYVSDWQKAVARAKGLAPSNNAFESFIDVDGEFVLERIGNLVNVALEHQLPIMFQ